MRHVFPVLALVLLLAGCASPAGDDALSEAPEGESGHSSDDSVGGLGGAESLSSSPVGEAWVFSGCSVARFSIPQDTEGASTGLPPDHRPEGDVAFLTLAVMDCEALSRGNHTVSKPFAWAFAMTPLVPLEADGALEGFVREIVTSDQGTATALSAFGFPVVKGLVALGASEIGLGASLDVDGEGLSYAVDAPLVAPGDVGADRELRLRGADGTRLFWFDCALTIGTTAVTDSPGVAVLEGGAMARQLGVDGPAAGTLYLSSEDWSCALVEHDSG